MQAETGQIGNGLKLTKKAKYDFESFTSHAHAKITKKQLENTYKSYCLPFKKNIYTSFFDYLRWGHSTTTWTKCYLPNFDLSPSWVDKMDITIYPLSRDPSWTLYWPPHTPLLVHVVIEWPRIRFSKAQFWESVWVGLSKQLSWSLALVKLMERTKAKII